VIPLKVAGAFHSSFMAPAVAPLQAALSEVVVGAPAFPVWSNTTARPHEPGAIAETLASQVVSAVRFAECLSGMAAMGIDTFVHIGPGDVTAGMARKTVPGSTVHVVSDSDSAGLVIDALGTM
jgi:malonyl CoA-acyl carrier protein transacylase